MPADSCFAQAVSISAATSALRASLVFIDRYPEEKQECEDKMDERVFLVGDRSDRGEEFHRVSRRFETAKLSYIETPGTTPETLHRLVRAGPPQPGRPRMIESPEPGHATHVAVRLAPAGPHAARQHFGAHLAACASAPPGRLSCGFAGAAGALRARCCTVFQDDRTYPFEAHAPFKVWAPLTDAPDCFVCFEPGAPRVLIFNQPAGLLVQSRPACRRATGRALRPAQRRRTARQRARSCPRDLVAHGLHRRCDPGARAAGAWRP